jgi:non-homologous end joining protein Ku
MSWRPGPEGDKPYALLRKAMEESGLAAVAVFVMRGKQYLAVIRPADRVLILETLYFADEVRDPSDVMDDLPRASKVDAKQSAKKKTAKKSTAKRSTRKAS